MLEIGKKAPDFCLPDYKAQKVALSDFFGKWVVLYFYPKDNTSGCTLQANTFNKYFSDFEDQNAVIIGVSPDSVRSHYNFLTRNKINFILLSDRKQEAMKLYDVWKMKKIYGREKPGVERSTFLINPGGRLVKNWRKVRVKGHVEEVLETLKQVKKKK